MPLERRERPAAHAFPVEEPLSAAGPHQGHGQHGYGGPASRRSSVDSQMSVVSIEPLHDDDDDDNRGSRNGRVMPPRRRSSNISFEKHNSVVMEHLISLIDDEDFDDDDEDSLDGIPTAEEAPEDLNEGSFSAGRPGDRRPSDASLDLGSIAAAVTSFQMGDSSRTFHNSRGSIGGRNNSSSRCVLTQIEDEIIENSIRAGKLVVDSDPEEEPEDQPDTEDSQRQQREEESSFLSRGHHSFSSFGSASRQRQRRGSLTRRASFAHRGSIGSVASASSSGAGRRVSFSRRGSAGSLSASSSARSSFRAGPDLHSDIHAALQELSSEDPELIAAATEDDDDEENDDAAIARAVLATGGSAESSGGGLTVQVEMAVPPPRTAMPRRSSMKRPDERRDWGSPRRPSGAA